MLPGSKEDAVPVQRSATDKRDIKRATRRAKTTEERWIDDMESVLSTPAGRRVVWGWMSFCRVFEDTYETSARIHYNEGMRNVGLRLMQDCQLPQRGTLFFNMMKEMHDEALRAEDAARALKVERISEGDDDGEG